MRAPRTTATLAALGLVTLLPACSQESKSGAGRPKIAFVVANTTLSFAKEMMAGYSTGVAQVGGVDFVTAGPSSVDGPRQVQIFTDLTGQASAGMSVFTLTPELMAPALKATVARKIPLIAVDNPPGPGSGVGLFIGNDNFELGRLLAREIIRRLPAGASGTVVLGTSAPGAAVLDRRADGMQAEFQDKLPGVLVVGPFDTKQDVVANRFAWQALVRANPHALAFLGTGDADGWNLADLRRRTHGTWLAGAFDVDSRSLTAVQDGQLMVISPEHYLKGAIAGRLQAQRAKDGGTLPKGWIYTAGLLVTRANVAEIIARQASAAAKQAWFAAQVDRIAGNVNGNLRPLVDAG